MINCPSNSDNNHHVFSLPEVSRNMFMTKVTNNVVDINVPLELMIRHQRPTLGSGSLLEPLRRWYYIYIHVYIYIYLQSMIYM